MSLCVQLSKVRGKKRQVQSCGDLTIYPIREIRGNRVLYGDQYDVVESDSENHYFVKNVEFHPDMLHPDDDDSGDDSGDDDEPIYSEITRQPTLRLSRSFEYIPINQPIYQNKVNIKKMNPKLRDFSKVRDFSRYHTALFSSHPSLTSYHSQSTDSGYRSVVVAAQDEVHHTYANYNKLSGETFKDNFFHHLHTIVVH